MPTTEFRIKVEDPTCIDSIKEALEDARDLEILLGEEGLPKTAIRPNVLDDSFTFDAVEFDDEKPGTVYVSYSFDWESYVGCRDISDAGTESDFFTGVFYGPELVVEIETHERDPDDY